MEILSKFVSLNIICEYLIKSSLVLGCSLFLVFILQKKSASLRHFILSFTLISLGLMPFLSSVSAGWETKLIPAWNKPEVDSTIPTRWINNRFTVHQDTKKIFHPAEKISIPTVAASSSATTRESFSKDLYRVNNFITLSIPILWSLGLLFLLLKIVVGVNGAFKLTRNGEVITRFPFQKILQQLQKLISIKRKIRLLSNQQISVPITWGVIKPVILLPEEYKEWTKSQCSSVLFHELSHIKRSDFIIRLITRFSCALFWFNPLIWMTYKLMKKEQEKACDELVINSGIKPSTYAANLLSIKHALPGKWSSPEAVLGALNKSQLNNRLIAILKRQIKPKEIKMKNKIFLSLIFTLVITVIGLARPEDQVKMKGSSSMAEETSIITTQFAKHQEEVQEIQEQKQEKKETEEKYEKKESQDSKEKKKGFKWVVKDEGPGTATLYITEADGVKYITDSNEVKKIILDGKLILVDKDGEIKAFSVITDEKDCVLEKDNHGNWTINGKKLELSEEDGIKIIKLEDLKEVVIKKQKDGVWIIEADKLELIKDGKLHVLDLDDENKLIIQSKDDDLGYEVIKIFTPKLFIKTDKSGHKNLAFYLGDDEGELKDISVSTNSDHAVWLFADTDELKVLGEKGMIGYISVDEGFQILFKSEKLDEEKRAKYDEIFEKIKNKLKGQYKVESEINEEDNTFILKIKGERLDKTQEIDIKELIQDIVEEIKKIRESKKDKLI